MFDDGETDNDAHIGAVIIIMMSIKMVHLQEEDMVSERGAAIEETLAVKNHNLSSGDCEVNHCDHGH